jgi:hypothetical protein
MPEFRFDHVAVALNSIKQAVPLKSHGTLIQIAQSSAPDDVVKERLRPSNLDDPLR